MSRGKTQDPWEQTFATCIGSPSTIGGVAAAQSTYERGTLAPEVAAVLRNARLRLGWSQQEAAYECRISRRHLQYLEAGERRPSDRIAERLIDGLRLRGKAVRMVRDTAVPGWRTRHGYPLARASGRGSRRKPVVPRQAMVTHRGSCWEHLARQSHPWPWLPLHQVPCPGRACEKA